MPIMKLDRGVVSGSHDAVVESMRRIGHIAGVLTIAVIVMASLYFTVLYLGAN